jgi:hypothetical protein
MKERMSWKAVSWLCLYTRYGFTYVLSTVSGRRLTILGGQVPEDVGWSKIRVV